MVYLDLVGLFPFCVEFTPVNYLKVITTEYEAVFCFPFIRIFGLLFFYYLSVSASQSVYPLPQLCINFYSFFSAVFILAGEGANTVLCVCGSYLLRSVFCNESAFLCSTILPVLGLLLLPQIFSIISCVGPQW